MFLKVRLLLMRVPMKGVSKVERRLIDIYQMQKQKIDIGAVNRDYYVWVNAYRTEITIS